MRGRPTVIDGGETMLPVLRNVLRNLLIERTLIPVYSWIFEAGSPWRDIDITNSLRSSEIRWRPIKE
jgi:hypothetical protein